MKNWVEKQLWWIALAGIGITVLIGLYPQGFYSFGNTLKEVISNYWLHISLAIVIFLLFVILQVLMKLTHQKSDPSA